MKSYSINTIFDSVILNLQEVHLKGETHSPIKIEHVLNNIEAIEEEVYKLTSNHSKTPINVFLLYSFHKVYFNSVLNEVSITDLLRLLLAFALLYADEEHKSLGEVLKNVEVSENWLPAIKSLSPSVIIEVNSVKVAK